MSKLVLTIPKSIVVIKETAPELYKAFVDQIANSLIAAAKQEAKEATPVGATGNLAGQILTKTEPNGFALEWFANYAKPVQYGFKKHWVPLAPLRMWVAAKLGTTDETVVRKIRSKLAKRDTPGQFYKEKASTRITARLRPLFRAQVELLRRYLEGSY